MSRQSLIALGAALVLGLLAVYFANIFVSRSEQRANASATTRVAVAAVPLDFGTEIKPEMIRFVAIPVNSLPAGTFGKMSDLFPAGQKRVALRRIEINEPILSSKVTGQGENASIAALLPDGMRAAAVRINDVSGVAGFVQPNDSVDVLITRTWGDSERTDVLLQDAKVLAMDQRAKNPDGSPKVARTATLQVEPVDAQKLALGQQVGSLSLVLRKPGIDQNSARMATVSLDDLRYSYYGTPVANAPRSAGAPAVAVPVITRPVVRRVARPAPRPSPPPASVGTSVEVVRGTQGSTYEVNPYAK